MLNSVQTLWAWWQSGPFSLSDKARLLANAVAESLWNVMLLIPGVLLLGIGRLLARRARCSA